MSIEYTQTEYRRFAGTSLAQAILDYENGYLTSCGLVAYFFRIKLAEDETQSFSQEDICQELKISKSAFYKALKVLKANGEIKTKTEKYYSLKLREV